MPNVVVVGAQWGDEGKGKMTWASKESTSCASSFR